MLLRLLLGIYRSVGTVALSSYGGVAQLVERLTGSQEVRGFESHRLHSKGQVRWHADLGRRASWSSDCNPTATRGRGCNLSGSKNEVGHQVGCFLIHLGPDMAVRVPRDVDGGMTKSV